MWLPLSVLVVSIHATRYSICTTSVTKLRFKPQALREKGRWQKEPAKAKSRGLLRYADVATRTAACAATNTVQRFTGAWVGALLDGCLDRCLDVIEARLCA
jgi:hypothetical protein